MSKYTAQELAILRNLFDSVDLDRSGRIHINQLPGLVSKLGKTQGQSPRRGSRNATRTTPPAFCSPTHPPPHPTHPSPR